MTKAKKPPYTKGRGECIFCGGGPPTREHIWAEWLKAYIPRQLEYSETESSIDYKTHVETTKKQQPGDPHSLRVKVVCNRCNSGWMGTAQERVQPHLVPLVTGNTSEVNRYAQTVLSMWAAMAIMVGEFRERAHAIIPAEERRYLMDYRKAPPHWRIWIGDYERDKWRSRWFHNTLLVQTPEHVPEGADDGVSRPNTQTTTLVVGRLYIHAMSSSVPNLVDRFVFVGSGTPKLRQIWPIIDDKMDWPPALAITNGEAHSIATAFYNWAAKRGGFQTI